MPTFDVPVHPLVVQMSPLNGCHTQRRTKPRATWYAAPDRKYEADGTYINIIATVESDMFKGCRNYYLWDLQCCAGCQEPKDVEYADTMRPLETVKA